MKWVIKENLLLSIDASNHFSAWSIEENKMKTTKLIDLKSEITNLYVANVIGETYYNFESLENNQNFIEYAFISTIKGDIYVFNTKDFEFSLNLIEYSKVVKAFNCSENKNVNVLDMKLNPYCLYKLHVLYKNIGLVEVNLKKFTYNKLILNTANTSYSSFDTRLLNDKNNKLLGYVTYATTFKNHIEVYYCSYKQSPELKIQIDVNSFNNKILSIKKVNIFQKNDVIVLFLNNINSNSNIFALKIVTCNQVDTNIDSLLLSHKDTQYITDNLNADRSTLITINSLLIDTKTKIESIQLSQCYLKNTDVKENQDHPLIIKQIIGKSKHLSNLSFSLFSSKDLKKYNDKLFSKFKDNKLNQISNENIYSFKKINKSELIFVCDVNNNFYFIQDDYLNNTLSMSKYNNFTVNPLLVNLFYNPNNNNLSSKVFKIKTENMEFLNLIKNNKINKEKYEQFDKTYIIKPILGGVIDKPGNEEEAYSFIYCLFSKDQIYFYHIDGDTVRYIVDFNIFEKSSFHKISNEINLNDYNHYNPQYLSHLDYTISITDVDISFENQLIIVADQRANLHLFGFSSSIPSVYSRYLINDLMCLNTSHLLKISSLNQSKELLSQLIYTKTLIFSNKTQVYFLFIDCQGRLIIKNMIGSIIFESSFLVEYDIKEKTFESTILLDKNNNYKILLLLSNLEAFMINCINCNNSNITFNNLIRTKIVIIDSESEKTENLLEVNSIKILKKYEKKENEDNIKYSLLVQYINQISILKITIDDDSIICKEISYKKISSTILSSSIINYYPSFNHNLAVEDRVYIKILVIFDKNNVMYLFDTTSGLDLFISFDFTKVLNNIKSKDFLITEDGLIIITLQNGTIFQSKLIINNQNKSYINFILYDKTRQTIYSEQSDDFVFTEDDIEKINNVNDYLGKEETKEVVKLPIASKKNLVDDIKNLNKKLINKN